MAEKGLISLDDAQIVAERFLEERFRGVRKIAVARAKLASIEHIIVYDVEGTMVIGGGWFTKATERPFRVQVSATDGAIVGFET